MHKWGTRCYDVGSVCRQTMRKRPIIEIKSLNIILNLYASSQFFLVSIFRSTTYLQGFKLVTPTIYELVNYTLFHIKF
jgi:hypothetical protein